MQTSIVYRYISLATRQFTNTTGRMCLYALRAEPKSVKELWFNPRDTLAPVTKWAAKWNGDGFNIYMSWSLFNKDQRSKATMVASCAFVADWDDGKPKKLEGMTPTLAVETSKGRKQNIYVHAPGTLRDVDATYKKLTKTLGCDAISSDPVHLWRVPGTMNWLNPKKKAAGRQPEMATWDGKTRGVCDVLAHAPGVDKPVDNGDNGEWPRRRKGKALTPKIRGWLRQNVHTGGRSEHLHKVVMAMCELGWGVEDIMDRVRDAPWCERFVERLDYYVTASVGKFEGDPPGASDKKPEDVGELRQAFIDSIRFMSPQDKERKIEWLWAPYLPRSEVTLLDGDSGAGKTTVMLKISKAVIDGEKMPNDVRVRPGHKVLYISAESDYEGFTLPVMQRMGLIGQANFGHMSDATWDMSDDNLDALEHAVGQHGFDLVVIDNLIDYVPQEGNIEVMNSYSRSSAIMNRLREVARKTTAAIVAIRHMVKGATGGRIVNRGMGSVGWGKGSRSQLSVMQEPDENDHFLLIHTKAQYAKKGPTIGYELRDVNARGVVEWTGVVDMNDEDVAEAQKGTNGDRKKAKAEARDDAKKWLAEFMRGKGAVDYAIIRNAAENRSISEATLQRAANELKIEKHTAYKAGQRGRSSTWEMLPE